MNAVASCFCPDIDHRVTRAGGGRPENPVTVGKADGHGIDKDIAIIGGIKIDLAADRGNADTIAIAADAGHNTAQKVACLFMIGRAKAQGVQQCYRPRTHGEDVAQNAANTGGRALIRLDKGGVIVTLDLENRCKAVTNIDGTGIFARPLNDLWPVHRQRFQPAF